MLISDLSALSHTTRDLRRLDIDNVVKVLRIFECEPVVHQFK